MEDPLIESLDHPEKPTLTSLRLETLVLSTKLKITFLPKNIIARHSLPALCQSLKKSNCEIIILGCTHFPYFYPQLKEKTSANLFEPSEEMIKLLLK